MQQELQHSTVTQGVEPSQECWYLRISEDLVFGPISLNVLVDWARTGRISDGYAISQDQSSWCKVEEIPELEMDWTIDLKSREPFGPFNISAVDHLLARGMIDPVGETLNSRTGETRAIQAMLAPQPVPVVDVEQPANQPSVVVPVSDAPKTDKPTPEKTSARVIPVDDNDAEKSQSKVVKPSLVKPSLVKPVDDDSAKTPAKKVSKLKKKDSQASKDVEPAKTELVDSGKTVVMPQSKIKEVVEADTTKPMPAAPAAGDNIADARETIAKLRTENTFLKRQAQAEREGFKKQLNEMMKEYEQAYEEHNRSQQETIVRETSYATKIQQLEEAMAESSEGGNKSGSEIDELKKKLELETQRREKLQIEASTKQKELQTKIDQLQNASAESVGALEKAREELQVAESSGGAEVKGAEKKVDELQRQVLSLQAEREKLAKAVKKQKISTEKGESEISKSEDALRKRIEELEKRTTLYAEESEKLKKQLEKEKQDFEKARHTVVKQAQSEIDAIKSELAKKDAQITSLRENAGAEIPATVARQAEQSQQRVAEAESRAKDLEDQLKVASNSVEIKKLEDELKAFKVKAAEHESQASVARDRIQTLEKDAEARVKQQEAHKELKGKLEQLQQTNDGLKADLQKAESARAKLESQQVPQPGPEDAAQVKALSSEMDSLKKSLKASESALAEKEAMLKDMEQKTSAVSQDKDALQKQLEQGHAEIAQLKARLQQSEGMLRDASAQAEKLAAQAKEKDSLEAALREAQAQIEAAKSEAAPSVVQAKIDDAVSKAERSFQSRMTDEQGRLAGQLEVVEAKLSNMQKALDEARASQTQLREENVQLSLKASEVSDSTKTADLEKDVSEMQDRCDKLVASLDAERATRDALKDDFKQLESRYKTRITDLEEAGKGVLDELAESRRVIENLQRENIAIREVAANDADQLTRQIQGEIARLQEVVAQQSSASGRAPSDAAKPAAALATAVSDTYSATSDGTEAELETVPTLKDVLGAGATRPVVSKPIDGKNDSGKGKTSSETPALTGKTRKDVAAPKTVSPTPAKGDESSLRAGKGETSTSAGRPDWSSDKSTLNAEPEKASGDNLSQASMSVESSGNDKSTTPKQDTAKKPAEIKGAEVQKPVSPVSREPQKGSRRRLSDNLSQDKASEPVAKADTVDRASSKPAPENEAPVSTEDHASPTKAATHIQIKGVGPGAKQLKTASGKDAVSGKTGVRKPGFATKENSLPIPTGDQKPSDHTGPAVKDDDVVLKGHTTPSSTVATKRISPVKKVRQSSSPPVGVTPSEATPEPLSTKPSASPATPVQPDAAKIVKPDEANKPVISTISPKKVEKHASEKYFLRIDEDQVFGPESVDVLKDWAGQLRVGPDHQLSLDKKNWVDAADVPGLQMDWLVEVDEGNYFGPFNAAGVKSLFKDEVITPETPIFNNKTESTGSASDILNEA